MNIDIDSLIERAKAATSGTYEVKKEESEYDDVYIRIKERTKKCEGYEVEVVVARDMVSKNADYFAAAQPAVILALCERLREAESAMKLSLKLLQDGEVDSAIDQIEEALNPEVSDE
ncbi:hypothetical protein ACVA51_13715 [Pseudomonas luteola]